MQARPKQLDERETGHFGVLTVRTPPDINARPAGIVLVDQQDRLYIRLLETLFSADSDALLVWEALSEGLHTLAADMGGRGTLEWLQDAASNFLEVEQVSTCPPGNPEDQLHVLFRKHVIEARQSTGSEQNSELRLRFTPQDLVQAYGSVNNSFAGSLQTIRLLQARNADLGAIERIIEQDPHLATHVIRLANLSEYSRGGEIRSVRQALIRTGTTVVLGYMVAIALRPLHSTPALRSIWNDSQAMQAFAQSLGKLVKFGEASELSLMGLIANIGKMVLFAIRGFEPAKESLRVLGYSPLQVERMLCGRTHAEVGADLLRDWGFPADMTEAVRFHHSPSQTNSKLAALLFLAESSVESGDLSIDIREHETALDRLGATSTQVLAASVMRASDRHLLYS